MLAFYSELTLWNRVCIGHALLLQMAGVNLVCLLLLTIIPECLPKSVGLIEVRIKPRPEHEKWLDDPEFYNIMDMKKTTILFDKSRDAELCPPMPLDVPSNACSAHACSSDSDCQAANHKCCYNGCVFTCAREVDPAAFLDWVREPRSRLESGTSWLVDGPEETIEVDSCSTTVFKDDDSDPLLCPHGYTCHIEDPGSPGRSIPNRGRCIENLLEVKTIKDPVIQKQTAKHTKRRRISHKVLKSLGMCLLGKTIIRDQTIVLHKGDTCQCHKGKIRCGLKHEPVEHSADGDG